MLRRMRVVNLYKHFQFGLTFLFFLQVYTSHSQCTINSDESQFCVGSTYDFTFSDGSNSYSTYRWTFNGTELPETGSSISITFSQSGTFSLSVTAGSGSVQPPAVARRPIGGGDCSVTRRVTVEGKSPGFPISVSKDYITTPQNIIISLVNPDDILVKKFPTRFQWSSDPLGYTGVGSALTAAGVSQTTTFKLNYTGYCFEESAKTVVFCKPHISPGRINNSSYRKSLIFVTYDGSNEYANHYWQFTKSDDWDSPMSVPSSAPPLLVYNTNLPVSTSGVPLIAEFSGKYEIRVLCNENTSPGAGDWSLASPSINVTVNTTPPPAVIETIQRNGYTELAMTNDGLADILKFATYYFVSSEIAFETNKPFVNNSREFGEKRIFIRGRDNEKGTWGDVLSLDLVLPSDNALNWIHTRSFDGVSSTPFSESKSYFDERGVALQSQSKSYYRSNPSATEQPVVFASQPLTDRYDRPVGSTLAAPILQNDFRYNAAFTLTNTGSSLKHDNFNKPGILNTLQKGTLGNYYGGSNGFSETNVPATQYPYSLSSFYEDGTGETKMSASPGDQHFLGSTHETLSGTFPVTNELDDYLGKRKSLLGITTPATTLSGAAVQQVVRDANGKYSVAITDKSGKTIMSARPSTTGSEKNCTAILTSQKKIHYFYLLNALNTVTVAGGPSGALPYRLEDIVSGQTVTPSGSWSPGFYRIIASPTDEKDTRTLTVTYKNTFTDISYQFYDDAGRLVSSISPKGVEQWATTAYVGIDKTTYTYNHQGWLLNMRETDAGETNYKYRRDGKIRFSQNAQQTLNEANFPGKGRFSYTNYDGLGRPAESGEYTGTALTFAALNSALEFASQTNYPVTEKKDWVTTTYDLADPNFNSATGLTVLPAFGVQNFVRTSVSFTENANNKTWYSYDELGRVTWMVQKPTALGNLLFTTQYQYDFLGNVLLVSNQTFSKAGTGSPTLLTSFYHHYTYDGNKRLLTASTSLDGSTLTLQASYSYYLHGPLKRIELATNLQGIDFVYNINGWLQSINDPSGDPGGDGGSGSTFKKDVFGMVLDYYQSTFGSVKLSSVAPTDFHGLPQFAKASNAPQNPREGQEDNEAILPFFKQVLLKNLEQLKVQLQEESGSGQFKNKGTRKVGLVSSNEKNSLGTNKP
jgi:hypothetical protein